MNKETEEEEEERPGEARVEGSSFGGTFKMKMGLSAGAGGWNKPSVGAGNLLGKRPAGAGGISMKLKSQVWHKETAASMPPPGCHHASHPH